MQRWGRSVTALTIVVILSSCGSYSARELRGIESTAPADFSFLGDLTPCYLELAPGAKALRVNCFHLDGVLHIHSNRFAKMPRLGRENWVVTVRREPNVRVEIADRIYAMQATPLDDEALRVQILSNRGYWYAWDGITVVRFSG